MSEGKVNFTSSILSDMTAKAAAYHNPENGRFAKMEILDDTGKIVREQYTLADDTSILLKATE